MNFKKVGLVVGIVLLIGIVLIAGINSYTGNFIAYLTGTEGPTTMRIPTPETYARAEQLVAETVEKYPELGNDIPPNKMQILKDAIARDSSLENVETVKVLLEDALRPTPVPTEADLRRQEELGRLPPQSKEGILIGGKIYYPADIMALPEDERNKLIQQYEQEKIQVQNS